MRIIVSDTSPIRALDHLGLLEMLRELFDEILIPPVLPLTGLENKLNFFISADLRAEIKRLAGE